MVYLELFDISLEAHGISLVYQKNQTTDLQYFQTLIINWICRSSNLESNFHGKVPKSRQRNASDSGIESLWQTNDRRSVTQVTILDALTHGLAPFPSVTEFRLPTESSEPCSHSIRKSGKSQVLSFYIPAWGFKSIDQTIYYSELYGVHTRRSVQVTFWCFGIQSFV